MAVDVETTIEIARPVDVVAKFMCDPDNAPDWYVNIKSIEWETDGPLSVGTRMAFVAKFLGKTLAYTYEVVEWEPERLFVMRTAEGPFPMETSYRFEARENGTMVTLRNRGEPSGFSRVFAPVMAAQMRKANEKDLQLLKRLLESG